MRRAAGRGLREEAAPSGEPRSRTVRARAARGCAGRRPPVRLTLPRFRSAASPGWTPDLHAPAPGVARRLPGPPPPKRGFGLSPGAGIQARGPAGALHRLRLRRPPPSGLPSPGASPPPFLLVLLAAHSAASITVAQTPPSVRPTPPSPPAQAPRRLRVRPIGPRPHRAHPSPNFAPFPRPSPLPPRHPSRLLPQPPPAASPASSSIRPVSLAFALRSPRARPACRPQPGPPRPLRQAPSPPIAAPPAPLLQRGPPPLGAAAPTAPAPAPRCARSAAASPDRAGCGSARAALCPWPAAAEALALGLCPAARATAPPPRGSGVPDGPEARTPPARRRGVAHPWVSGSRR